MRSKRHERFSVFTSSGIGSYGSRSKAIAAAEWVARESDDSVSVLDETTGQIWEISAARRSAVAA